jgi:hypothetical protein
MKKNSRKNETCGLNDLVEFVVAVLSCHQNFRSAGYENCAGRFPRLGHGGACTSFNSQSQVLPHANYCGFPAQNESITDRFGLSRIPISNPDSNLERCGPGFDSHRPLQNCCVRSGDFECWPQPVFGDLSNRIRIDIPIREQVAIQVLTIASA